ncbi:GNAT family N-acetyltransferase [Tessaracoccus aquimaris]|uniref:GNAT family N-acetyltransferase n=1 Tax=Tessaracoccus aquimaris TaxID=1332264 RepID=UPI000988D46E|nr:GNAT family N-acetyltransferase [Tessaracoccus aquimaris]
MSGFQIRRAADHELERVVRLRWLWTRERGQDAGDEQRHMRAAAAWAREHRETHLPHIAVDTDDTVIGMAWLALTPRVATTTSLTRVSGDLQSCYVLPHWRGKGVGGALVRSVLDTARAVGLSTSRCTPPTTAPSSTLATGSSSTHFCSGPT